MESAELLDLLGNETRRRILALLARKPCYVTEISDATGVSPKAVIDHLEQLEDNGLIECRRTDNRRKYFSICQAQHLEVTIAPHEFGTINGYLRNHSLDNGRFSRLDIEFSTETESEPAGIIETLEELQSLSAELSRAQRFVHGEMNRLYEAFLEEAFAGDGARLDVDVLLALEDGPRTRRELARQFGVPARAIDRCLQRLSRADLVEDTPDGWARAI